MDDFEDVYAKSYRTKKSPSDTNTIKYYSLVVFPVTLSRTLDDNICLASFIGNDTRVIYNNINSQNITQCVYNEFYTNILPNCLPSISISQVDKTDDGVVTCKVVTTLNGQPISDEVYVTTSGGYLSRLKLHTNINGEALFKWSPMLLETGDQIEIKCGFKNYSNVANLSLEV